MEKNTAEKENLFYNHDFFYYGNTIMAYQQVVYNNPDGWDYNDPGPSGYITYNTSQNCCEVIKSRGNAKMTLSQTIPGFSAWEYQCVKKEFVAAVFIATPGPECRFTISLDNGICRKSESILLKPNKKRRIPIRMDVDPAADQLTVTIECSHDNARLYIYNTSLRTVLAQNANTTIQ